MFSRKARCRVYDPCACVERLPAGNGILPQAGYKIPREGLLLEEDLMQSAITHIRHDNRDYICFITLDLSLDVTDPERCASAGIEITDRIEVIAPVEES